jgi:PrtD family type I secretion system ABC transporter
MTPGSPPRKAEHEVRAKADRDESRAGAPRRRSAETVLRQASFGFAAIAVLSAAVNALVLVSPLYMFQVFDRVLVTYRIETLFYLSLIAAICVAVLGIFDWLRGLAVARLGRWWDETMRPDVFDAALVIARLRGSSGAPFQDLQTIRNFVGGPGVLPFFDAPWTPLFVALIFLLHPLLGFIAIASAVVIFALAVASDLVSRRAMAGIVQRNTANLAFAAAVFRNADAVHAMGMQENVTARFDDRQRPVADATQRMAERLALISAMSKAIRIGVQIAILGLGAYLATKGDLTSGGMIAGSIILGRALAPVEQAIGSWRGFTAAREAHRRLRELLRAAPAGRLRTALPAPKGRMQVENVTLVMPGSDKRILQNISFTLDPGTVLALVGPSAAGKSSLCRLLVGSWTPSAGRIRLDGAELAIRGSRDHARYIGYLPQGIELFAGTVKENIARFGEATDEDIVEAARRAACHEMILSLPNGYETEIGEGGAFLSGGQRQRVALARALFGETRLLVLDEPSSNLDQEGEQALIDAVGAAKRRGATIIIVSHRMAMMRAVDMIGMLRNGRLEALGTRDDILQRLRAAMEARGANVATLQPPAREHGP